MFGLEANLSTILGVLFIICILATLAFEFVNGFHDTANAVATVIYTKSLKPNHAVVWSGFMNFCGLMFSATLGLGVAMKIANLLPIEALIGQDIHHAAAMVLAILIAAISWNLSTWYFGIPCSSSHTLIGSILGAGMVFSFLPENVAKSGVNWAEAVKIGKALLLSPAFGFSLAVTLMFLMRVLVKNKQIFKEPEPDSKPPLWIRMILICTCTLVSFFHGQNDGQKGVGLILIVLMCFMPLKYSLSPNFDAVKCQNSLTSIQAALPSANNVETNFLPKEILKTHETIELLKSDISTLRADDVKGRVNIRKRINLLNKNLKTLLEEPNIINNSQSRKIIKTNSNILDSYISFVPLWAIIMIALSLGLGTMIGWKRIVVTIGEKIGKRHMTYAEGASAELIAAFTIGLATQYSLPVSTTHVLSSGVAGSMVASKGVKNLQKGTIANIALAWVLTFPVTLILSGALYLLFRLII
jgi:phosphate/sulfate permease